MSLLCFEKTSSCYFTEPNQTKENHLSIMFILKDMNLAPQQPEEPNMVDPPTPDHVTYIQKAAGGTYLEEAYQHLHQF